MGGSGQHGLQAVFELGRKGVRFAAGTVRRDRQRFADVDAAVQGAVDPGFVTAVFFIAFDSFQQTLDGRLPIDVAAWITFQHLGEGTIVQVPPTGGLFLGRSFAIGQGGEDGGAKFLDSRHGGRLTPPG